jgi:SAM-dependent methyltransferase
MSFEAAMSFAASVSCGEKFDETTLSAQMVSCNDMSIALQEAGAAYRSLAPFYDRFTADYDHEAWLGAIDELASMLGLGGRRLLDIACGTGKSFVPMLERGYDVTACDLSPEMVAIARTRLREAERAFVADMRALPQLGQFDLVTCLDDSVNYLGDDDDLRAAFANVARVLAPDGLYVFDVNSLRTYRTAFASCSVVDAAEEFFCWRGEGGADARPGARASATIDVFWRDGLDGWRRITSRHVQRHHPRARVEAALDWAGLRLRTARGQVSGGRLVGKPDERRHAKVLYVASPKEVWR